MRAIFAALILLLSTAAISDEAVKRIYRTALPGVVEIYAGSKGIGTGFVVSTSNKETVVVTAKHVIVGEDKLSVVQQDGSAFSIKEIKSSASYDVARIVTEPMLKTYTFRFDTGKMVVGETVYIIGHPGDYNFTISSGYKNREDRVVEPKLTVSAFTWYGNSGGPVLNSNVEVVGMLVGGPPDQGNISTCVSAETIKKELANMESKK